MFLQVISILSPIMWSSNIKLPWSTQQQVTSIHINNIKVNFIFVFTNGEWDLAVLGDLNFLDSLDLSNSVWTRMLLHLQTQSLYSIFADNVLAATTINYDNK